MVTRFITLFEGRTGSSYFIDCLNSLPHIEALGETLEGRDAASQRTWIDEFFGAARPPAVAAIGFKTKLRDIKDVTRFRDQIHSFDVRIIHMIRLNKVKLAVSRLNAKRLFALTGTWNRNRKSPALPPFAPTFEEFDDALRFRMARERPLDEFVAALDRPRLTISYEQLLADQPGTFAATFQFIGVRPGRVQSALVKNTDDDLRRVLTNFDALRGRYAGTEYERMFDE